MGRYSFAIGAVLFTVFTASAGAQMKNCVPQSSQQLIIYRAGSLTRAFEPLVQTFSCQTGIQVTDVAMGDAEVVEELGFVIGRQLGTSFQLHQKAIEDDQIGLVSCRELARLVENREFVLISRRILPVRSNLFYF